MTPRRSSDRASRPDRQAAALTRIIELRLPARAIRPSLNATATVGDAVYWVGKADFEDLDVLFFAYGEF